MLRVILVGYGELASSLMLGVLESRHKLVSVFRWDKTESNSIRSLIKDSFWPNNFLSLIKTYKIPEINAKSINSEKFIKQALKLQPDVILVGAWGEKIKSNAIILPKIACVNCHPSLLPAHRGPNPYSSTIKQGETRTGITFHLVDEKFDTGHILLQKEINILESDTGGSLREKCAFRARDSVKELLDGLENALFLPQKQDESRASYFPRLTQEDAAINWEMPASVIYNQIRGLQPWIDCFARYKQQFLMIKSSKIIKLEKPVNSPGKILLKSSKGIVVSTGNPEKALLVNNLYVFGFLKIFSDDFINKIKIGDYMEETLL
ncbi:MAG: methionyl-tRNA formyltransferase [Candidatus Gastranaerophilales bacterium]|nr:methionyl-tRNA formyltransferase [Candidatus Gastranaerophilales bacterium]